MSAEAIWRYALATILLLAALVMAFPVLIGTHMAVAGTYNVEAFGAKISGSSIAVSAIVVFIASGVAILSAGRKQGARQPPAQGPQGGHDVRRYMLTMRAKEPEEVSLASRVRRRLWMAFGFVGLLVVAALATSTHIRL